MIKFALTLLFMVSCATRGPHAEQALSETPHNFKFIQVKDIDRARVVIKNKQDFYRSIFTQSTDPYYGVNKWNEKCLADNQFDEMKETATGVFAVARLYMTDKTEAGFCAENLIVHYMHDVYFVCKNEPTKVRHLTIALNEKNRRTDWTTLCP